MTLNLTKLLELLLKFYYFIIVTWGVLGLPSVVMESGVDAVSEEVVIAVVKVPASSVVNLEVQLTAAERTTQLLRWL